MRFGWVVAVAVLFAGCGSSDGSGEEGKASPSTSSSKAEATKALDDAYENFTAANTGRFRAKITLGGQSLTAEGTWDLEGQSGDSELSQPGSDEDGAVDGVFTMRSRSIGTHVYGGPSFGPAAKCWFDYGSNAHELQGLPVSNDYPWYHPAMILPTEARAIGFANDNPSEIDVEVWADTAMSVLFNKLMIAHYDELPTKQIWAPGTMTLQDGDYSTLKVPMKGVFGALEKGGVEFDSDDEREAISGLKNKTLTIALDKLGSAVTIEAPAADTLIDATSREKLEDDPELCAAADD